MSALGANAFPSRYCNGMLTILTFILMGVAMQGCDSGGAADKQAGAKGSAAVEDVAVSGPGSTEGWVQEIKKMANELRIAGETTKVGSKTSEDAYQALAKKLRTQIREVQKQHTSMCWCFPETDPGKPVTGLSIATQKEKCPGHCLAPGGWEPTTGLGGYESKCFATKGKWANCPMDYVNQCCQPFGPQAQNIKEYRAAQRGVDEYTKAHAEKGGHAARRQV